MTFIFEIPGLERQRQPWERKKIKGPTLKGLGVYAINPFRVNHDFHF